jgi:G8 domain
MPSPRLGCDGNGFAPAGSEVHLPRRLYGRDAAHEPSRPLRLIVRLFAIAVLVHLAAAVSLAQSSDPGATVVTHHETIPNPVIGSLERVAPACRNTGSPCPWEQAATWTTGQVPSGSSRVIVDGAVRVTTTTAVAASIGVYPGGHLSFAPQTSTRLSTADLVVFSGGTLEVGTAAAPILDTATAEIVIRDLPFAADPGQHLRGIVVVDGTIRIHGRPLTQTFLRLATAPASGASTLTVSESPPGPVRTTRPRRGPSRRSQLMAGCSG